MDCHIGGGKSAHDIDKAGQFLNVIQRVYDEGLKLVVKTNERLLFIKTVLDVLNESERNCVVDNKVRIFVRLRHMFPDFS